MIGTLASVMHVVDDRRLAEQALDRRQRRLERAPGRACPRGCRAARFPRRRCTRRRRAALRDRSAGRCRGRRRRDSRPRTRVAIAALQRAMRVRIFAAQIDVALRRADRDAGDRHAFDRAQNGSPSISMRSENVPESPSSALQTMYFCAPACRAPSPLDAGRKRRAAAAAQTRIGHRLDDVCGRHRERVVEPAPAAVRA